MLRALALVLLIFININVYALSVVTISNPDNIGDQNALNGFLKKNFPNQEIIRTNYQPNRVQDILFHLNQKPTEALVAIGDQTIETLLKLPTNKIKTIYLSHTLTSNVEKLINVVNQIVLPQHTLNDSFLEKIKNSSTNLEAHLGVYHDLDAKTALSEYQKYKSELPNLPTKSLVVILAGDVFEDDDVAFFTKESAIRLARTIRELVLKSKGNILILSAPRTGKFDPKTKKALIKKDDEIDPVTQAFVDELNRGLPLDFALFPFQKDKPSLYKAIIGLLLKKGGDIWVPGESTSMISETLDVIPHSVTIYAHEAMKPHHHDHIKAEIKSGRAKNFLNIAP